jgi:hypothetical protein
VRGKNRLISITLALGLALAAIGPSAALYKGAPASSPGPAVPAAPEDTPDTLVGQGVTSYGLSEPKLFWYTWSGCVTPPGAQSGANRDYTETIKRIATYGGLTRTLWENDVAYPQCQDDVRSDNIVADDDYVYWVSRAYGGVVRLPTDANPGDPPELLNDIVSGPSELAQDDANVYVMSKTGGGVYRISKSNGSRETVSSSPGASPHNLRADGRYVYWITGGELKRVVRTGTIKLLFTITTGVTGYYPEGRRVSYCHPGGGCVEVDYVFIAKGRQVVRFNNLDGTTSDPIYASNSRGASIHTLVTDPSAFLFGHVFLIESRELSCDMLCTYENVLVRLEDRGGGTAETLHATGAGKPGDTRIADHVRVNDDFVFWQENDTLKRLPQDADALPLTDMRITGLEITQSVQDLNNSVRLIQNRRTFVRVYVESDGDAVPGVTAYLYRTGGPGAVPTVDGPLVPVNPVGQQITVHPHSAFYRLDLNRSFLFELPWDWTTGTLYLRAVLNPNHVPPQASYANNTWNAGPFTFQASPRLQVQFVSFGYDLGGQTYYPHLIDDVFQTYSWIRRTYPLASTPGSASDPSPGFRPNLWIMYLDGLGSMVDGSNGYCELLYPDPKYRNLCASAFTNAVMKQLRVENGVPGNVFMYGMISDRAGHFPRGQASGSGNVSSGPAGSGDWGWDSDGTYADWYAGHEIGHTLGRSHPYKGSTLDTGVCNQGPDDGALDQNYPYQDGRLASIPSTMWGFDVGDDAFDLPIQLYPGAIWFDVMTYCGFLWVSDYTYDGMYSYMMAHPSSCLSVAGATSPRISGDFLGVYGSIAASDDTAIIHSLRRVSSVATIPDLVAGDEGYRIRLLGSGGAILADYDFTPEPADNTPMLSFGQVVTFMPGTTEVQIVRGSSDRVLASESVSANPPVVQNVALQGSPPVVAGTVTLTWTASDNDGDALSFDVHYSADGGASFQPLQVGVGDSASDEPSQARARATVEEGSVEVDTTLLAGSDEGVLRVVTSDGVQTSHGDTDPFVMAHKPPQPRILSPGDGTHVHYGQLINFSGEAMDAQDGSVVGANLDWSTEDGPLGSGALLSIDDLPVGVNHVTLTAENSAGLSAITSIDVIVDDDLELPGPALSVAPMQVGWHVAAGTTADQTEEIQISNAAGGTLYWVAEEDAAWLTLNATNGTAPATLELTADPAGLEDGTVLSTTLRITSPLDTDHLTETMDVPVRLLVGDVYHLYPTGFTERIYLPLVLRRL